MAAQNLASRPTRRRRAVCANPRSPASNPIRRLDAAFVANALRRPPVQVAAGTVEAACAHVASLIPPICLLNRQIKDAQRQIDALIARLAPSEEAADGTDGQAEPGTDKAAGRGDPRILAGSEKDRPRHAARRSLRCPAAARLPRLAQSVRRRPCHQAVPKSCVVVRRQACHNRLANAVYEFLHLRPQCSRIRCVAVEDLYGDRQPLSRAKQPIDDLQPVISLIAAVAIARASRQQRPSK